jgi:hypothetical protein
LHHCLTGRNPSESPLNFPDLRRLNPSINRETAAIIKKAVALDMEKRFQSAIEMKQAIQKKLLDFPEPKKGTTRIIHAQVGKPIKLPWSQKISWVSVPVSALGCSGTTGTLSSDAPWIQPKPGAFGIDATRLLFRVENKKLKLGREYRSRIIVKTDEGILRPQLVFKKTWPWIVLEAAALAVVIGFMVMAR